jgi:hypothetical protein
MIRVIEVRIDNVSGPSPLGVLAIQRTSEAHLLSVDALPDAVVLLILHYLSVRDLCAVASTQRRLHKLVDAQQTLWYNLMTRVRTVCARFEPEYHRIIGDASCPHAGRQPRQALAWHYCQLVGRVRSAKKRNRDDHVAYQTARRTYWLMIMDVLIPIFLWVLVVLSAVLVVWRATVPSSSSSLSSPMTLVYFVPFFVAIGVATAWFSWAWACPHTYARGTATWCCNALNEENAFFASAFPRPRLSACILASLLGTWACLVALRITQVFDFHWVWVMVPLWVAACLWCLGPCIKCCFASYTSWIDIRNVHLIGILIVAPLATSAALAAVRVQFHLAMLFVLLPLFFIDMVVGIATVWFMSDAFNEPCVRGSFALIWLLQASPWIVCKVLLCLACDTTTTSVHLTPLVIASPLAVWAISLCVLLVALSCDQSDRIKYIFSDKSPPQPPALEHAQLDKLLRKLQLDAAIV